MLSKLSIIYPNYFILLQFELYKRDLALRHSEPNSLRLESDVKIEGCDQNTLLTEHIERWADDCGASACIGGVKYGSGGVIDGSGATGDGRVVL